LIITRSYHVDNTRRLRFNLPTVIKKEKGVSFLYIIFTNYRTTFHATIYVRDCIIYKNCNIRALCSFLGLLVLVSQRAETQFIELFGSESMIENLKTRLKHQRGNGPSFIELIILHFVVGKLYIYIYIRSR